MGRAFTSLWVRSSNWPRRVPSLPRLTRSRGFLRLHSGVAGWLGRNFELIEAGAPWLDRAGYWVCDHCDTGLNTRPFSFPRDPPSVTCRREVTVVYGIDGTLPGRLGELATVCGAVGWGDSHDTTVALMRDLTGRERPVRGLTWSPVAGLSLPAGLETMPPDRRFPLTGWLYMSIDWASRGEPQSPEMTSGDGPPRASRTATAIYEPLEVAGTDVSELAGRALVRHEHVVTIRIEATYYLNANVNARPGRLRKRLLPAQRRP